MHVCLCKLHKRTKSGSRILVSSTLPFKRDLLRTCQKRPTTYVSKQIYYVHASTSNPPSSSAETCDAPEIGVTRYALAV